MNKELCKSFVTGMRCQGYEGSEMCSKCSRFNKNVTTTPANLERIRFYEDQNQPAKATDKQVDGTHYNKLKIQPIMLSYQLNASPCFCKLAKYITRDKDNKAVQMQKAEHVIELERDLKRDDNMYGVEPLDWDCGDVAYHDAIKAFSLQFKNPNCIYNCLAQMFVGEYDKALTELKFLKMRVL